jgi:hypothetical protein
LGELDRRGNWGRLDARLFAAAYECGNTAAVRHGSYALLRLAPRAEEIATGLRELVPFASPADAAQSTALVLVLPQLERIHLVWARCRRRNSTASGTAAARAAMQQPSRRQILVDSGDGYKP